MFTVGIDLGTTSSVVAFIQHGEPRAIPIDSGKKTTPSVVNYGESSPIIGREAICKVDAANTVFSIKRSMGTNKTFFGKTPEEISADILSFLKSSAEIQLRERIENAVITVPAHFSEAQRIATKRAASIAGIKVLRLISEPAAAAIAFGLDKKANGVYAVYDVGGGTFDFSILRLSDGVFQVLATGGDSFLGGDDVDDAILEYNFARYGLDYSSITDSERMFGKLIVKSIKECLGSGEVSRKNFVFKNEKYEFSVTKDEIAEICSKYVSRTFEIVEQAFKDADVKNEDLDGVVLVGGMTKMQYVKDSVQNYFKTTIYDNLNPDEVVALGAAIQAKSIESNSKAVLLIDVAPLSIGVETLGGGVDKIIHRNTPIPVIQKREYTTYQDNQRGIKFQILQGERPLAKDCRSVAQFELSGIPKMPAGVPRVIVEFYIDVNGLLNVKAYEKTTGVMQSITVEPSAGLTDEKMVEILENAMKNHEEDEKNASYLFIKIESERQIIFWKSILNDIPEKERKIAAEEIELLKKALEDENYHGVMKHKKNVENIVGEFLDEIVSEHFSRKGVNVAARK